MTGHEDASTTGAKPRPRRRRRVWRWLLGALVLVAAVEFPSPVEELFWGFFAPSRIDRIADGAAPARASNRLVLLVSFDGLARTVLELRTPSTIADLARDGSVAAFANTNADSTLESHGVMISSQSPGESGFNTHTYRPWSRFRGPTLFTMCAHSGLRCALFTGKAKLAALVAREPGCERFEYHREPGEGRGGGGEVLRAALTYIRERDPDFVMLHLPDVDVQGHRYGWGSQRQLDALSQLDRALGEFLVEASMATPRHLVILLSADHGGYGTAHREMRPEVRQVPLILWGDGIAHQLIADEVSTLDIAPTIAGLLGVAPAPEWRGRNLVPSSRS